VSVNASSFLHQTVYIPHRIIVVDKSFQTLTRVRIPDTSASSCQLMASRNETQCEYAHETIHSTGNDERPVMTEANSCDGV